MATKNMLSHVLLTNEAELLIESLDTSHVEDIGSKRWWYRHETLEKLNIQAVVNATNNCDDFIKEFLVTYKKIPLLISELIVSELWTEKAFPYIHKQLHEDRSTLPVYMAIFHEATVAGLLETIFYYQEVCEESGDAVLDLIDFINRKLLKLIQRSQDNQDCSEERSSKNGLLSQHDEIEFTIAMKCISLLLYISNAMEVLPLSAITRMLNTHDMPCLLVQILDLAPWKRKIDKGDTQIYTDGKWVTVLVNEQHLLPKLEGQVWLALYQLLMHPESQRKYEYNSYRKTQVLKVRRYMHEVLLDQLPYLAEMQRFLENLSVMEPPAIKQDLIIEQIPEIRPKLIEHYKEKWELIATKQLEDYFIMDENAMREQAQRLAATYDLDVLESLIEEPPVCANCHNEATKRCSRCQNEWYCSRPCQVKHWKSHKGLCDILSKENAKK